jgi:hypothetical protein
VQIAIFDSPPPLMVKHDTKLNRGNKLSNAPTRVDHDRPI